MGSSVSLYLEASHKNVLAKTDPEFINLAEDPRNFSPRELNKLFGRKFVKEMFTDAADENKMENIRQRRSRFLPRNGNIPQTWRYHQGGQSFSSESTPYRKENVNSRFCGNGFVTNKIHNNRDCKVGAKLNLFWKNWEKITHDRRMTIELIEIPKQISAPGNVPLSNESFKICDQEVNCMLDKGANELISPSEDGFVTEKSEG